MDASVRSRLYLFFEFVPKAVSVLAIVVGTLVFTGWVFNLDTLKSVIPGLTFMKSNTAIGFILTGLALLGIQMSGQSRPLRVGTRICAFIVLLLSLLTLLEYLSGADFGIDQLLIREVTHLPGDIPGRMAVNTAVSFAALSVALMLLSLGKGRLVVAIHALAVVPLILGGSALIGYGYDIDEFLREKLNYTPMALTTAAIFLLLTMGVLNARAEFPFRRFASSGNPAGVMVRRLLPAAIGFTLVAGWLIHRGYHAGYYGEIFVQALFTAVTIAGMGAMILANARTLYAAAVQREQLEEAFRSAALYARTLIEASLDPLVTISADGMITDVNEATVNATGVAREELIGSEFSGYFTDPDMARAGYREVFFRGFVKDYPLTLRHASGRVMEVLYNASEYRDAKGEVAGVFAAARDITERKRAEEALRRSAEEIEDLYNRAPIGYHSVNKDGTIVRINDTELAWLGYSRDEVVGRKNFADLLTPESLKTFRATFAGSKARGWVRDLEYDMVRGDGTVLPVLLSATAVKDAQGNFVMSRSTIYDITERRKLEARILEAASYARSLIEASPDPLVTVSAEGMITDVNEATIRATGVSRENLIGSDFSNYFTEPDMARAGYQEVFAKGFVTDYPLSLRHVSGRTKDVLYNASVYRNAMGEVAGVFAAARDITDLKRVEEELRAASLYARSLIEASLDPLVTISVEGKVTDVNEATVSATGVIREILIGSDFSIYFTEPDKARAGYQEVFAKGYLTDYPLTMRHISGKEIEVLYNASVYRNVKGEVAGVFAAARDITELRKLERELEFQAHKDMLTGLNNRRHFFELADQELARFRRHAQPLSLLMMDLDNFKSVNDTYGHHIGDAALRELSEVCLRTFREFDLVGRIGGEEFAALLPETNGNQAMEVAERLRLDVENAAVKLENDSLLHITISIGVATLGESDAGIDTVLERADRALYRAKNSGRNRVCGEGTG